MHFLPCTFNQTWNMHDRGVAKPITPAKHGKRIFLPHLPSQNISVCLEKAGVFWEVGTYTNRATIVSAETGGYHKTNWVIAMLHFLMWLKHRHIKFLIALYLFGVILARLHLWFLDGDLLQWSISEHFPARNLRNLNNMGAVSQQVQPHAHMFGSTFRES